MKYYKATATFKVNGSDVTISDIKASDRNYSHAVATVAYDQNPLYYRSEKPNPEFGKPVAFISFHQGSENAMKAAAGSSHRRLGGFIYTHRNQAAWEINPTAEIVIIETVEVDAKTYREFKKNFTNTNDQVKVGA